MAEKRKRGHNFTSEEKDKLVKLLMEHKSTILNKRTDGCTNEAKLLAWTHVTTSFNATASVHRTKESLMKVWEKMKSESKTYYSTTRRSASQTGGGPSIIKTDPILEQVCSIMGRGCSGIEGISDSDRQVDTVEATMCTEESLPKVISVGDGLDLEILQDKIDLAGIQDKAKDVVSQEKIISGTPIWSRRRPISSHLNERSEAISTLCSSYKDINKKKEDVENLKHMLLKEEYESKQRLNALQIQAAEKDLIIKDLEIEIKKTVLEQVRGGGLALQNLFGVTPKTN